MIKETVTTIVIATIIGFAGLLLEMLSGRALGKDTPKKTPTGYHARICRLCFTRDLGRVVELVAMVAIAITMTWFWMSGGAR